MSIIILVMLVVVVISAISRNMYSRKTNRINDAFNRYIDDYVENGLSSREPYTRTWQEFLDKK